MAASQNLRHGNVVDAVRSYLNPDVVRNASSLVGESESSTTHTMHSAIPGLLSGLLNFSSTSEGANSLAGMIRDGGYGSVLGNPASLFAGGGLTSSMASTGQSVIGKIFGNRASSVSNAIASSSGVKASSAGTLMNLLAPLTLGAVGQMAGPQGLNADGVTNLLRGQRKEITEATPSEVSHILGLGGGPVLAPAPSAMYVHEERTASGVPVPRYEESSIPGPRRWIPLLLVGLAALGLLLYLFSRGRRAAEPTANIAPAAPSVVPSNPPSPAPTNVAPLPGPNNVYFETGSTRLTPDSRQTVNNFEAALRAHPGAQIQLAGNTDNTGNPQANQQLSLGRANAVKALLVSEGVDANRISTTGNGQDSPVASNDTEEGRARNRRTELTVTGK